MAGGLFDPLGKDRAEPGRDASRPSTAAVLAALAAAALAVLFAVSYFRDDGGRGQPVAVAPIEHVRVQPVPPVALPVPATAAPPVVAPVPAIAAPPLPPVSAGLPPVRDDQEVEIQNGVRVVRPRRDGAAQGGRTLRVPDDKASR